MTHLLNDATFWVLISFVVFLGVFWKFGKDAALKSLDDKILSIKKELEEAEALRIGAQELLAEYQRKHKDAIKEANALIADAKKHAENIREKAEADMKKAQDRRVQQLNEKLERIEQAAKKDIESYTAKLAIDAARDVLSQNMDAKSDKQSITDTMASLTSKAS